MDQKELTGKMVCELQFNSREYDDGCGEMNHTLLSENMADKYDLYEDDTEYQIPDYVFDAAVNAVEKWQNLSKEPQTVARSRVSAQV